MIFKILNKKTKKYSEHYAHFTYNANSLIQFEI